MFTNLIKTSIRFLFRNKLFTVVNILGLTIGISCSFLIYLWVQDELNFDTHNNNYERICRLTVETENNGKIFKAVVTPVPLLQHVISNIPEVETGFTFRPFSDLLLVEFESSSNGILKFYEDNYGFADSTIFNVLTFDFLYGDPKTVFRETNSVVLTEALSLKYFGDVNPIGKTINLYSRRVQVVVKAVIKDLPLNTHLRFDMLFPFELLKREMSYLGMGWGHFYFNNYILLKPSADISVVNNKLLADSTLINLNPNASFNFYVQELKDVHLNSDFDIDIDNSTTKINKDVYSFTFVALFILLIACINFMNLSTAQSLRRAKEVGIRKVVGVTYRGLVGQFLAETMILTLISLVFAIILVEISLPAFNDFTGKSLMLHSNDNISTTLYLLVIAILIGILSGIYPAFVISKFHPIKALKGGLVSGKSKVRFRKLLTVFQFVLAVIMIVCALVVYQQLNFLSQKKLGYNKEQLIYLPLRGKMNNAPKAFKKELLNASFISNITYSSDIPTNSIHLWGGTDWEGNTPDNSLQLFYYNVDYDFIKTMGIELVEGRDFSLITDSVNYILNEAAVKAMGLENPVGNWMKRGGPRGQIIGVVKNFHFKSLKEDIAPMVIIVNNYYNYVLIRIAKDRLDEAVDLIKGKWKSFEIDYPAEIHLLDKEIENLYSSEYRLGKLFTIFSIMAVFISCMGLFGLATYLGQLRQKEIGVRKVFGAKFFNIVFVLLKEYFLLLIIANILGGIVSYLVLVEWLRNFAHHINFGIDLFLYSFVILCVITVGTVLYHVVKLSLINPVETLKCE